MLPSIRIEGSILSADILGKLDTGDLSGQRPADFGCKDAAAFKDDLLQAWTSAQAYYRAFRARVERLPESSPATTETRNLWITPLLALFGYTELEFQQNAEVVGDKPFRFSHRLRSHGCFVVHTVGARDSLDKKRTEGTNRSSPHGHVQEYLNLTEHLFALVTNGRVLRLLRDATRLVKLSYVEFDLDRMFSEELFADFRALYRLLHVSRLPRSAGESSQCFLERYHQDALDAGSAIRAKLGEAVKDSILRLGNGFLNHPANDALRQVAAADPAFASAYYQQLLRLVYRFLFLMVVEERDILYAPGANPQHRRIYYDHYSLARLRRLAEKKHLTDLHHTDAWLAVRANFRLFDESSTGLPLGLNSLGGDLFDSRALGPLTDATLDNATLLTCLQNLALFRHPGSGQLIRVNYAALNVEEFGSVYQGLLDFEPQIHSAPCRLTFAFAAGDERSKTGSHYTPEELVQPLLKHSLDYLIADALKKPDPATREVALLALKVCDVACGSGHILLAAARRIATALAILRTGDDQPSPSAFRTAVRDVIRHCIYGMDLNPLAVELCKVALWLEAHVPGQPLTFLDHRIHCGNAIVGLASYQELQRGIPDEAFKTLPGDDKDTAAALRKQNKAERKGFQSLNFGPTVTDDIQSLSQAYRDFDATPETAASDYYKRRAAYDQYQHDTAHDRLRTLADLQVAQFYLPKTPESADLLTTHDAYHRWLAAPETIDPDNPAISAAINFARRKRIAHWFIEFWDVIHAGGFDLILGNPPYLGGQALSGSYGHSFCEWVKWEYAPTGLSELVVYFLRRIYELLKRGGFVALITTNSIKDGDVRADGMEHILRKGGNLNFAVTGIRWPGIANLSVSLFSLHKGPWEKLPRTLDGVDVPFISAFFEGYAENGAPLNLPKDHGKLYLGSYFLGSGFLLSHGEAAGMLASDKHLSEVILPLINGEEVNSTPLQIAGRSAVYFSDWPLERAQAYGAAFERVVHLVKPERDLHPEEAVRKRWWLFKRPSSDLYGLIRQLPRCFALARVTKFLNFSAFPTNHLFSETVYILPSDKWNDYAVVQSTLHEVWARKYSGALETRLRYSPTDCFATFAFPKEAGHEGPLASIGESYHEHRRELMRDLWLGLTGLYNLFHRPDLTPEVITMERGDCATITGEEGLARLLRLRELHIALDTAVLAAYGWDRPSDFGPPLQLRHGFQALDNLPENDRTRFTLHPEARREVLARLLKLNHQRAAAEMAATLEASNTAKARASKPKPPVKTDATEGLPLFTIPPTPAPAKSFVLPNGQRPTLTKTSELFLLLIPALVQEASGPLSHEDLLVALSFLNDPPAQASALPGSTPKTYSAWRKGFPAALVNPTALRAALHDLIVQRHLLNLRPSGESFEFFPGMNFQAVRNAWTITDAKAALAMTSRRQAVTDVKPVMPAFREAVPLTLLYEWFKVA